MTKWMACFLYETSCIKEKQLFWIYLTSSISMYENYWLMIGDLNENFNFSKQSRGRQVHTRKSILRNL